MRLLELGLMVVALGVPAAAQTYVTFDPPGSTDTRPLSINESGSIAGEYANGGNQWHGFARDPLGSFTVFDPVGSTSTYAASINPSGDIAGWYLDASNVQHGFVRDSSGTITVFDVPGGTSTLAVGINAGGTVVGFYMASAGYQGFIRQPSGTIETISYPKLYQVVPAAVNDAGVITGYAQQAPNGLTLAFERKPRGATKFVRAPDGYGSIGWGINRDGAVAGTYEDSAGFHCFVWKAGVFTPFDPPGNRKVGIAGTRINSRGEIIGASGDARGGLLAGFLRTAEGVVVPFRVPSGESSYPSGINDHGDIVGYYQDAGGQWHGFLRTPK